MLHSSDVFDRADLPAPVIVAEIINAVGMKMNPLKQQWSTASVSSLPVTTIRRRPARQGDCSDR
jgi:hypothetical protein